jgi:hypothetical protein
MNLFFRLFLDDERHPRDVKWVDLPPGPWTIARNYDMFVDIVKSLGVPSFVTFDHDLGAEAYAAVIAGKGHVDYSKLREKTGYHCAKWLVEHCLEHGIKIPDYEVHSMNPVGADNIRSVMESGRKVQSSLDK